MTTRRTFLKSSMFAAGTPLLAGLGFTASATADIGFLTERDCANARAFAACLGGAVDVLPADLADYLGAFERELERGTWEAVFGLTRDSNQFLLSQIAARHGYRLTYCGTHDARSGVLVHTLQGDAGTTSALARRIRGAGRDWPAAVAALAPALVRSRTSKLRRRVNAGHMRQAAGLPYLTSWALLGA